MSTRFLHARHWQLFTLSFGIPFLAQLLGTTVSLSYLLQDGIAAAVTSWPYYLSSAGSMVIAFVLYGWLWSTATGLQTVLPREFRRSTLGFTSLILALVAMAGLGIMISPDALLVSGDSQAFTLLFWTLLPLFTVWVIAHVYSAYFVADSLLTAEQGQTPNTDDLIRTTLLIWLFPVGIWIVQPRINRLIAGAERKYAGASAGAEQTTEFRPVRIPETESPVLQ